MQDDNRFADSDTHLVDALDDEFKAKLSGKRARPCEHCGSEQPMIQLKDGTVQCVNGCPD